MKTTSGTLGFRLCCVYLKAVHPHGLDGTVDTNLVCRGTVHAQSSTSHPGRHSPSGQISDWRWGRLSSLNPFSQLVTSLQSIMSCSSSTPWVTDMGTLTVPPGGGWTSVWPGPWAHPPPPWSVWSSQCWRHKLSPPECPDSSTTAVSARRQNVTIRPARHNFSTVKPSCGFPQCQDWIKRNDHQKYETPRCEFQIHFKKQEENITTWGWEPITGD